MNTSGLSVNMPVSIRPANPKRGSKLPLSNVSWYFLNKMQEANTGDIVAVVSNRLYAKAVNFLTKSSIGHVEIMLDNDRLLESVSPKVHIKSLQDQLKNSRNVTEAYLCKLKPEIRGKILANKAEFDKTVKECVGKPYESLKNLSLMMSNYVIGIPKIKEDTSKLTCSEVVGYVLKKLRIIPESVNVSELSPKDIVNLDIYESIERIK